MICEQIGFQRITSRARVWKQSEEANWDCILDIAFDTVFFLNIKYRVSFSAGRDRLCRQWWISSFWPLQGKRRLFLKYRPLPSLTLNGFHFPPLTILTTQRYFEPMSHSPRFSLSYKVVGLLFSCPWPSSSSVVDFLFSDTLGKRRSFWNVDPSPR